MSQVYRSILQILAISSRFCLCQAQDPSSSTNNNLYVRPITSEEQRLEHPVKIEVNKMNQVWKYQVNSTTKTKAMRVHFDTFNLLEGDKLMLKGVSNNVHELKASNDQFPYGYWSDLVDGDHVTIEFQPSDQASLEKRKQSDFKVVIGGYNYKLQYAEKEAVCGKDNSVAAKCFTGASATGKFSNTKIYDKSKGVIRILTTAREPCTGTLIGAGGQYALTAAHCIQTKEDAQQAKFEFGAESNSCQDQCRTPLGCPGPDTIEGGELVIANTELDYAIIKLRKSLGAKYSTLSLRKDGGAKENEPMFIPHHPSGFAKLISFEDDYEAPLTVKLAVKSQCPSEIGNNVGYKADTVPGSSGAPVVSATDFSIIAVHRCGGCDAKEESEYNVGTNIKAIVQDLEAKGKALPEFF